MTKGIIKTPHLSMSSFCRQALIRLATRGQLSRLTCDKRYSQSIQNLTCNKLELNGDFGSDTTNVLLFKCCTVTIILCYKLVNNLLFQFLYSPSCHACQLWWSTGLHSASYWSASMGSRPEEWSTNHWVLGSAGPLRTISVDLYQFNK